MNSFLKGATHSIASSLIMWVPMLHFSWLNITIGGIITIGANWILSHTIPTTTGASAKRS